MKFDFMTNEIVGLYEGAKENGLVISSLSLKNSKFIFNIKSVEKQKIYDFLKSIDSSVDGMSYDSNLKEYVANASYKIHRR